MVDHTTVLTPAMVSSRFHLSERWLARRRHERNGPRYAKVGKRILYRAEDVEHYLAQSTVEARD